MTGISLCVCITLIREFSTERGDELGEQGGRDGGTPHSTISLPLTGSTGLDLLLNFSEPWFLHL